MSNKKKILFVDDDSNFLDGLRRMLHRQRVQWDMHFMASVDEALNAISKTEYDVIVSDIMMPGKNGFDFLEALGDLQRIHNVPTFLLTGNDEQTLKRRALKLGATDLLNKPIDREDLIARIESLIRMKSFQDNIKANNELLERTIDKQTIEIDKSRLEVVWKLAKAAEARDKKTGNHILRVGHYCRVISEKLGMEDDFTELIFLTSPLHDIGKIGIPDKILLKPGKLTPDEKRIMDQHCVIGAEILLQEPKDELSISAYKKFRLKDELSSINNPILKMGASIALGHHEWWNGKGYPKGLSGENIPLEARIVAISDMYDALSFSRPYKPAFSEDKISLIMRKETVSHFDPVVFSSFEKVINDLQSIKVQYSDE